MVGFDNRRYWFLFRWAGLPYEIPRVSHQPGDALLDQDLWLLDGVAPITESGDTKPSTVSQLLSLAKLTEALVLHERLFFWVSDEPPPPLLVQEDPAIQLIDNDLLIALPFPRDQWRPSDERVEETIKSLELRAEFDPYLRSAIRKIRGRPHEPMRGDRPRVGFVNPNVGAQDVSERLGLSHESTIAFSPFAHVLATVSSSALMCSLQGNCQSLRMEDLRADDRLKAPISVPMPAIVAEILRRTGRSVQRYLSETLALREQFGEFRREYMRYQKALVEPSLTASNLPSLRSDYLSAITRSLAKIKIQDVKSRLIQELYRIAIRLPKHSHEEEVVVSARFDISSFVSKVGPRFTPRRISGRVRLLFDLADSIRMLRQDNFCRMLAQTFRIDEGTFSRELREFDRFISRAERIAPIQRDHRESRYVL